LIISIALSGVYLIFSILLLKGIKEVRKIWNPKFTHHLENKSTNLHRTPGIKYGHG
jgi:hypothetical protein